MLIPENTNPHTIAQWEYIFQCTMVPYDKILFDIIEYNLCKGYVMSVKGFFIEKIKSGDNGYECIKHHCIWNYRGECFDATSLDRIASGNIIFNDSTELKYNDK